VIGGGPAGARVAQRLAAGGASVLLLESEGPDVDNLCSGLLNSEGQAALGCDVPAHVRREPFEPQLEFHDADNRLRRRYAPGYWNTDRPRFDAWLRECAQEAGAVIEYQRRVSRIESGERHVELRVGGDSITASVVLDATGWRALSRKLLARRDHTVAQPEERSAPVVHAFQGTVSSDLPPESMWAIFHRPTTSYYGWLVPKGEGRFLLGAGYPQGAAQTRREGQAAALSDTEPWAKLGYLVDYIERRGFKLQMLDDKPLGCPITTITSVNQLWWGRGRVFPVGEAAGLVSPSSGDGIHFCLEHANAIADLLLQAGLTRQVQLATGPRATDVHSGITNALQSRLSGALAELRFNCFKARLAARPLLRGLAARVMGFYLRRPVEKLDYLS
jgi:flavin-dependent dehydrogenase